LLRTRRAALLLSASSIALAASSHASRGTASVPHASPSPPQSAHEQLAARQQQ
jgi:hypothetical protein